MGASDPYDQGELIWLDADTLIRQRTGGRKSLDDFARGFFGVRDGSWVAFTYTFDDLVAGLNDVLPFDWATFLRARADAVGDLPRLDGIERGGYRLVYTDQQSPAAHDAEQRRGTADLRFSLGMTVDKDGAITDVVWDGPAFQAGLGAGAKILAADGTPFTAAALKAAVTSARDGWKLHLLVSRGATEQALDVPWSGGLRYPHLQRIPGAPALLDDILAPRHWVSDPLPMRRSAAGFRRPVAARVGISFATFTEPVRHERPCPPAPPPAGPMPRDDPRLRVRVHPADEWERLAAWSRSQDVEHDVYGDGGLVEDFERKLAGILGKETAVFMPSGVMAQLCALRIHAETARLPRFGMHATSHLALHEEHAYSELMHLESVVLGEAHRPLLEADLAACREPLSSVVVELPIREAGGQLPDWSALEALKASARQRGIALHMDGARLWECAAWYGTPYARIADGFASVYVSIYKGLGGLAGAVLAGDGAFVAQARVWRRRMGGTLYRLGPLVASAAMRFDERLEAMPALYRRTLAFARALAPLQRLRVNPAVPQTNMLNLHIDGGGGAARGARPHRRRGRHLALRRSALQRLAGLERGRDLGRRSTDGVGRCVRRRALHTVARDPRGARRSPA